MRNRTFTRAFITGGSSGIGLAAAEKLVQEGTHVLLIARDRQRLEKAAGYLRNIAAQSVEIDIIPLDITKRDELERTLGTAISSGKVPDLLLNCAGMAFPDYFESMSSDVFEQTLSVNVIGTWNVLKAVVPKMNSGSHVVNVSSVAGFLGLFGYSAYSTSKFGIIGMSEALRNELSVRDIGVSVLCPPDTDTPQLQQENLSKPYELKVISGNGGVLSPQQVAESLLAGVKKGSFMIIPGRKAKLISFVKRFFPGLIYKIIDTDAKKAYRSKNSG